MSHPSVATTAPAVARSRAPARMLPRHALPRPRDSFFPISSKAAASMPPSCARRWSKPSAPPIHPAPGTGRRPTTLARRRPFCSCANTASRFSAKPALQPRRCRSSRRSPAFSPPTRGVPRRARPSSSSRRRSRSASPRSAPPPSCPATACWSLRPAPASSPSWRRSPAARSC